MTERRRSERLRILGTVPGQVVSTNLPIELRDISLNGLSFGCQAPLPVGNRYSFRLMLGDGALIYLTGDVVHCDRAVEGAALGEQAAYIVGIVFVDERPDARLVHRLANS